jgi:hypothetical protein
MGTAAQSARVADLERGDREIEAQYGKARPNGVYRDTGLLARSRHHCPYLLGVPRLDLPPILVTLGERSSTVSERQCHDDEDAALRSK